MGAPTHRMTGTPTYNSWAMMHRRCRDTPSNPDFADYGGRGITVCDRWSVFENFLADMGERPVGTTLDREDTDGNYEPGNCRWATAEVQQRDRRNNLWITHEGETRTLADWSRRLGIDAGTLRREWRRNGSLISSIEGRKSTCTL